MEFEKMVWKLLKKIPRGKVTTYKIIAIKLNSKAYRAVGLACKNNPYTEKVPCHRVVKSSGNISGYSKGMKIKKRLLKNEGIKIRGNKIVRLKDVLFRF
jgi:methylated-DNA-[protein]-cysteine S-methyltransferase